MTVEEHVKLAEGFATRNYNGPGGFEAQLAGGLNGILHMIIAIHKSLEGEDEVYQEAEESVPELH